LGLFIASSIWAQDPNHFKVGEKEFANTDIYTLLYDDRNDILYVGTNNGLYAYKQNRFIAINRPKEQIGSSLFQLQQNNQGHVFCCNLNGQIFRVYGNEMELYHQASKDEIETYFVYFFDEKDHLITVSNLAITKTDVTGNNSVLGKKEEVEKDTMINNVFITAFGFSTSRQVPNGDIYISDIKGRNVLRYRNGVLHRTESLELINNLEHLNVLSLEQTVFAISMGGKVSGIEAKVHQKFQGKSKESFFQANELELLGLGSQSGARILKLSNDTLYEQRSFFDKTFLSTACWNSRRTLFLGTFGSGIIVIPSKSSVKQVYEHLFLGIAASPDNDVFLSTRGGKVFEAGDELQLIDEAKSNIDHVFYVEGNFEFTEIERKNLLYETDRVLDAIVKDVYQINRDVLLYTHYGGVGVALSSDVQEGSMIDLDCSYYPADANTREVVSNQRGIAVTWSSADSLIYYSTGSGVIGKHWSSSKSEKVLWEGASFLGNDLEYFGHQLICGTEENGVLFFENNQFVRQLSEKEGLKSNAIKKVKVQDQLLYLLTRGGMQVYDLENNRFLGLGVVEGGMDEGVTNFTVSNDKLWLLEKHSYYSVDLSEIKSENKIAELYLDSILVNGNSINYSKKVQFGHKENAFSVFFDYRNIESKAETQIQYTLVGFYTDWKTVGSSENRIEFQSLPVGKYTFKIKAIYRDQETKTFSYTFEILPPYWQRWWFYLLLGLTVAVLIMVIAMYRIRYLRKKNVQKLKNKEIEKNAIDAQLKALRAQMNPHFIFNSINSIQDLVLQQETIKSYDYLVVFSKLVRSTLDFSEREFISIAEEIEFLEVYLSLEKLRFKDDFEYEIQYDGRKNISIPSLIIQPFVENALKHGLLHKDGMKKLKVTFTIKEQLVCEIIDNGVGRAKSERIKAQQNAQHRSFSTEAIKQRMQMLSSQYNTEVSYETIDLKDENQEPAGTKVIVQLPYDLENVIR
jgi:hypothetical protein